MAEHPAPDFAADLERLTVVEAELAGAETELAALEQPNSDSHTDSDA